VPLQSSRHYVTLIAFVTIIITYAQALHAVILTLEAPDGRYTYKPHMRQLTHDRSGRMRPLGLPNARFASRTFLLFCNYSIIKGITK
jgi:hypothetical protein